MGLFNRLDEAIKAFKNPEKHEEINKSSGEGLENVSNGYGMSGIGTFNSFYNNYINRSPESEIRKIHEYRTMATLPEIADVIEDAVNESLQTDENDRTIKFKILDPDLANNKNLIKNITTEFNRFFYEILNINDILYDFLRTYYIDGRVFYERIINEKKKSNGIIAIKKLPSETMNYVFEKNSNKILYFYQTLKSTNVPIYSSVEEAMRDKNIIVFYPDQIGFINTGMFGVNRKDIIGYLDKARIPYNQLKLLETSVIIYRLVRAPERFVFKIDTGQMPLDKAMKFVEKVKTRMTKRQSFNPNTGRLSNDTEILALLENFFIPVNQDGRGSDIETIGGGGSAGFTELDDIYYFSRKLYRALKYPMSRVTARQEKREGDLIFGGSSFGDITLDEIKWARFLEQQNNNILRDITDLFLVHLRLRGQNKAGLNHANFRIILPPPNKYKEQLEQKLKETKFNNFQALSGEEEFSKTYLMRKELGMTQEEIEENYKSFKLDKKYKKEYIGEEE